MSLLSISRKIETVVNDIKDKEGLEIEAKIKNISQSDFTMVMDFLKSQFYSEETFSIDYFVEGSKRITHFKDQFTNTTKESLYRDFLEENSIKFSISKEKNYRLNIDEILDYEFSREKNRTSYFNNNLRYDMTRVVEKPSGNVTYELEIEVINPQKFNPTEFSQSIKEISDFISNYRKEIIRFCNLSLSDAKDDSSDEIKYYLVSRLRDLKKKDLTIKDSILRGFTVSVKADGIQYFLLFHKSGCWLISHTKPSIRICGLEEEFKNLENSIFVGEVVDKEGIMDGKSIDSMNIFLPFDTISFKGVSVVNKNYLERCSYFKEIYEKVIFCDGVRKLKIIEKKIFNLGKTSKSFYTNFKKCHDYKKDKIYKDDGYIFTPIESSYVAEGQIKNGSDRILSKYLDVCKFKPVELRSLDFKVEKGNLYFKVNRGLKIFRDLEYSLDFQESLERKIVEFFPEFLEDGRVIMKPSRIRSDKIFPNTEWIVNEIVSSYFENNPITENTLLGKDTVLMRDFNNKIKSSLIKDLSGYVLDIGGGKGGDIGKYGINSKIKKVLAVEPNLEFAEEFSQRLEVSKWREKFGLLKGVKGEDSEIITKAIENFLPDSMKEEKLTITFMISLSFFWSSKEILNSLARTLNEVKRVYLEKGGDKPVDVVFFTIDGEKVETLFQKYKKDSITLNTITLGMSEAGQVMVDIRDSKTVSNQIEYLVKLEELFSLAGMKKVYLKDPKIDKDLLMSIPECIYISLFVFGKYSLTGTPSFSYKLPRLEVNPKKGVTKNKRILAKNDDTYSPITFIGNNIYRIATMDLNMSLSNSIQKLINKSYREGDVHKRLKLAKDLHLKIKNKNLDEVSEIIDFGIKVFNGKDSKKYGEFQKEWIILNMCIDYTYEPIIYKNDSINYTFSKDSFLIN